MNQCIFPVVIYFGEIPIWYPTAHLYILFQLSLSVILPLSKQEFKTSVSNEGSYLHKTRIMLEMKKKEYVSGR